MRATPVLAAAAALATLGAMSNPKTMVCRKSPCETNVAYAAPHAAHGGAPSVAAAALQLPHTYWRPRCQLFVWSDQPGHDRTNDHLAPGGFQPVPKAYACDHCQASISQNGAVITAQVDNRHPTLGRKVQALCNFSH